MTYNLQLVQAPSVEPVSLTDLKDLLKISDNLQDTRLTNIIAASREAIENYTNSSLLTQQWQLTLSIYGCFQPIQLPRGPIQSITSANWKDQDTLILIPNTDYYLESGYYVYKGYSATYHTIEITYQTGYGDNISDLPNIFPHAILEQSKFIYECPHSETDSDLGLSPYVSTLLYPYKQLRL